MHGGALAQTVFTQNVFDHKEKIMIYLRRHRRIQEYCLDINVFKSLADIHLVPHIYHLYRPYCGHIVAYDKQKTILMIHRRNHTCYVLNMHELHLYVCM